MRRLVLFLLTTSNLFGATQSFAQDVTSTTAFDWSGFYAGVFGGGAAGEADANADDEDVTTGTTSPTTAPTNGSSTTDQTAAALLADGEFDYGDFNIDDESWLAGANVGFNIQNGRLVFGAVGDIMGTDLGGSSSVYQHGDPLNYYGSIQLSADWLATLRGLIGVTSPDGRFLFYVTGGLAVTDLEASIRSFEATGVGGGDPPPPTECGSGGLFCDEDSDTVLGVALGAGVGAHLTPNLVLDLSYLFADFSDAEFEFGDDSPISITGNTDVDFSAHLGRIGLTYYFGAGPPIP